MKKKVLMAAAICASVLLTAPVAYVSAAEVDETVQSQSISTQSDVTVAPYADEIVTKFRVYKNKLQYRRWNQTRGYWVDKKWIDMN